MFRRRKKFTAWRPKYREPIVRRSLFRAKKTGISPKIYQCTYQQKKFQTSYKFQRNFYLILTVAFVCGLVYLCFFSGFFEIKKITLVNNKDVYLAQVEGIIHPILQKPRFLFFSGKNIFFVDGKSIKNELLAKILQIENLEIKKRFPDVLKIVVYEKEPKLIWLTQDKSYFVDGKGEICYEVSSELLKNTDLPVVFDNLGKEVKPEDKVLSSETLAAIENIHKRFHIKTGHKILHFEVPAAMADEVHVKTETGFKVYFNCTRSIDDQLNDLHTVLEHQIKDQIRHIQYIDLRIEGWVYYR